MEAMTPEEIGWILDGVRLQEAKAWDRTAWLASIIIRSMTGKKYSPEQLLGRKMIGAKEAKKLTREEAEEEKRALGEIGPREIEGRSNGRR